MLQAWGVQEAARIVGVPYRTVKRWLDDGLVCLCLHRAGVPWERLRLLEEDVLELWAIASLRKQGVSLQRIRRILARLASMLEREQFLLTSYEAVLVEGDSVFGVHDRRARTWEDLQNGQLVISVDTLKRRLEASPGEPLPEAWELLLQAEEVALV